MKMFNIYVHPVAAIEAVKVGFSWPAFFFGGLWMLDKGLWGRAALWLGGYLVVRLAATLVDKIQGGEYLSVFLMGTLAFLALIAGINGNRWKEQSLVKRGYRRMTTLAAPTPEEAIFKHLDRPNADKVRPRSSRAVQEDHQDRKLNQSPKPTEHEPHSTASA
jgi:hypothetical protein